MWPEQDISHCAVAGEQYGAQDHEKGEHYCEEWPQSRRVSLTNSQSSIDGPSGERRRDQF